jgi:hypothetical protein
MAYFRLLKGKKGEDAKRAEAAARVEAFGAPPKTWQPPEGKNTMDGMTFAAATRWIGRDVIVRDDPNFGKRGRIVKVIADADHGFLAAIAIYRWERGAWVMPIERGPARFLRPGRIELT